MSVNCAGHGARTACPVCGGGGAVWSRCRVCHGTGGLAAGARRDALASAADVAWRDCWLAQGRAWISNQTSLPIGRGLVPHRDVELVTTCKPKPP